MFRVCWTRLWLILDINISLGMVKSTAPSRLAYFLKNLKTLLFLNLSFVLRIYNQIVCIVYSSTINIQSETYKGRDHLLSHGSDASGFQVELLALDHEVDHSKWPLLSIAVLASRLIFYVSVMPVVKKSQHKTIFKLFILKLLS